MVCVFTQTWYPVPEAVASHTEPDNTALLLDIFLKTLSSYQDVYIQMCEGTMLRVCVCVCVILHK